MWWCHYGYRNYKSIMEKGKKRKEKSMAASFLAPVL
jgi:hypothetical protein